MDIKERKDRILGYAIDQYIKTVSPVSSQCIAKLYKVDLSSATIRNILADLEDSGYLTHPHTSAGRIPTEKGYRYYVDNLMQEIHLLEEEKTRIKEEYARESLELEILLEKTSEVISEITNYTSIISVEGWGSKIICKGTGYIVNYPEYNDLTKIKSILEALERKEKLLDIINRDIEDRINIFIGQEIEVEDIEGCSLIVSKYDLKDGPSTRVAVLGPTRMNYERVISMLEYLKEYFLKTI